MLQSSFRYYRRMAQAIMSVIAPYFTTEHSAKTQNVSGFIWYPDDVLLCSRLLSFAHLIPDRHDCFSPYFSVISRASFGSIWCSFGLLRTLPINISNEYGLFSRSLISHLQLYFLCNILIVSSHHMAIARKAFLRDIMW